MSLSKDGTPSNGLNAGWRAAVEVSQMLECKQAGEALGSSDCNSSQRGFEM